MMTGSLLLQFGPNIQAECIENKIDYHKRLHLSSQIHKKIYKTKFPHYVQIWQFCPLSKGPISGREGFLNRCFTQCIIAVLKTKFNEAYFFKFSAQKIHSFTSFYRKLKWKGLFFCPSLRCENAR